MPKKAKKKMQSGGAISKGVRYQLFGGAINNPPGGPPIHVVPPKWRHPGPVIVRDMPPTTRAMPWHGRIISRGLRAIGARNWADKAHQMGLGYVQYGTVVRKVSSAKIINA